MRSRRSDRISASKWIENGVTCKGEFIADVSSNTLARGLTRIRPQLAIYFCLHRGSVPENTAGGQPRFRGEIDVRKFRKKLYVRQNRRLYVWLGAPRVTIRRCALDTVYHRRLR